MLLVRRLLPLAIAVSLFATVPASANGETLYFDCPCTVSSDGEMLEITVGVRSFRSTDSGPVRVVVRALESDSSSSRRVARTQVARSVTAQSRLTKRTREATLDTDLTGLYTIQLRLEEEQAGNSWQEQDKVWMELPVDLAEPFDVGELDYLKDTDGDGVSDPNELLMDTDPKDADSAPGRSIIDVVALYTQGYSGLYPEPTTRIQHVFALANAIFVNSELDMRFRVVGMVPVALEEEDSGTSVGEADVRLISDRHGADLRVLFRKPPANSTACGWVTSRGSRRGRGHFGRAELERIGGLHAHVVGNCSGGTLSHELGHVMGLGHAVWQNDSGTWRWSRGHAVENEFNTTMSYGRGGIRLAVFSSPDLTCRGVSETDYPCGITAEEVQGADAAASLDAVRFQIAKHRKRLPDSDRDGFVDPVDDLPNDSAEWWDTDGDGVGNNADLDDDGDGASDTDDAFPLDATETRDSDGDGVGNNADAFPRNASETSDSDGDGVGDNADAFPDDPAEAKDTDGDGVGDNTDPFPRNPSESADTDGDGIGDNADPDADGDGVADTLDLFPLDSRKSDASSYWLVGEQVRDGAGQEVAGSPDGSSILIGAPDYETDGQRERGAVYLISRDDLPELDAADGAVDRAVRLVDVPGGMASWKFVGENPYNAGASLAIDDIDGDGVADAIIGAKGYRCSDGRWRCGAVFVASGTDFEAADAADGVADHIIALKNVPTQPHSWQFLGEAKDDGLGWAVTVLGDIDGDGDGDFAVGAPGRYWREEPAAGSTYVLASGGFEAGDRADGSEDGIVDLRQLASMTGSLKLVGESPGDMAGSALAAVPDLDGDGLAELLIGAERRGAWDAGAAYLASSAGLAAADRADGSVDSVAALARIASVPGSWRLAGGDAGNRAGDRVASAVDGDETRLLLSGFLLDASALSTADRADGTTDGTVDLSVAVASGHALELPGGGSFVRNPGPETGLAVAVADVWGWGGLRGAGLTYLASVAGLALAAGEDGRLSGSELADAGWRVAGSHAYGLVGTGLAPAGDVDGDTMGDLLLGAGGHSRASEPSSIYLLLAADLPALDRADGRVDGVLQLGNVAGDTDGDGLGNSIDLDDDGDSVPDAVDVFPLDPRDSTDADQDGFGDRSDAFPNDREEWLDTDRDGTGDNADTDDDGDGTPDRDDPRPRDTDDDGITNRLDPDDDNDGVADGDDAFPVDATETVDTDGDGIGDNADRDDDNDGVGDATDAFPLDPAESADSDGDGTGDNADAFPNDPNEQADHDGDGIGDNADPDDDNDGVEDESDDFPRDAMAKRDADGDSVADSRDAFPRDAGEWLDTDSDGVGNNADRDDDGDGVPDAKDRFPLNAARSGLTSMRFLAENDEDLFGTSVAFVGDLDGDAVGDIAVGAIEHGDWGAAYLVSASALALADAADGIRDGAINALHIATQADSWKLVGEEGLSAGSMLAALGDLGDDGTEEFIVGAEAQTGALFIISNTTLPLADALDGDVDGIVDIANVAGQSGSWKVLGTHKREMAGSGTVAFVPESEHLLIGQPGHGSGDQPGEVRRIDGSGLAALDPNTDGVIAIGHMGAFFVGEAPLDRAGASVAVADFDGDGDNDMVIGAPGHDATAANEGAVYLVGSRDISGPTPLASVAASRHSWKFVGGIVGAEAGRVVATGDVDGDGQPDLMVGQKGSVQAVSGTRINLARFDRFNNADRERDGVIDLRAKPGAGRAWTMVPTEDWSPATLATPDVDGDGRADTLVGRDSRNGATIVAELFLGAKFDQATGKVPSSYRFLASPNPGTHSRPVAVATAGDIDKDGLEDFLIGVPGRNEAYLIIAADLPLLDADDGVEDGTIHLSNIAGAQRY